MSEKEKAMNLKPLVAYETMKNDIQARYIPGFEKMQDKDNFRRYNRKGVPAHLLGQLDYQTDT